MSDKLEFTNAPIIELVCGVQFEGVVFDQRHIFETYDNISKDFPDVQINPPLNSVVEKLDAPNVTRVLAGFHARNFFINVENTKLIQVQPDKLFFNWRKTSDHEQYPHFVNVFEEFLKVYKLFTKGKAIEKKYNQLELTYFDHILLEDFKKEDYNPRGILNVISTNHIVKSVDSKLSIPFESLGGNINLSLQSATRNSDKKKVLVLETTARGFNKDISLEKWFNIAHKEILDLFKEITTKEAKEVWGMK